MKRRAGLVTGLLCLIGSWGVSIGHGAVSKVICVPWQGDITKYHTTLPGGGGRLKGVIKTTTTGTHYYRWIYGDGSQSAVLTLSGNTWYTVEDAHVYAGAIGTPFTAQLIAADNSGLTGAVTDTYLVKIEANTLDARVNVGIDNGLWYTYKQGTRSDGVSGSHRTFDGQPSVYWTSAGHRVAPTASAVQAFEINGSKETGNFDEDPYAEYVARGLKFLLMGYVNAASSPNLRALTIGVEHGTDDPDGNGNGIGIEVYDGGAGIPTYQGGQVMDAIIASGTPGASSGRDFVGNGHISTYADIIQDMTDMYAWGQEDGAGACTTVVNNEGAQNLAANGVPQSITLEMLNTRCSLGGTFEIFVNGISLGTVANDPANSCTCNPSLQTFVVNNAAALAAAWNANAAKILRVTYTGGGYNANVRAKFDWGGGNVRTICVRSVANCFTVNLCDGYNGNAFDTSIDLSNVNTYTVSVVCPPLIGSWQYSWNQGNDNSAAQWAAIGMIPAQLPPWNAIVPSWVKTTDDAWLTQSHTTQNGGLWGKFGYTGPGSNVDPYVDQSATTPSGMVQLSFVDATTADPRWVRSERWIAENWDVGAQWFTAGAKRNLYAMYAMTKAMRLAKPTPVVNFSSTGFDWYRGDASHEGVAKALSDNLIANGFYNQSYWEQNPLATAWAVIMLKPELFAASPIACFTAHPNPAYSDLPISFEPGCSGHSEPGKGIANLTKFEWDWDNNGTYDETTVTPTAVSHSFHCATVPCTFPVKLRVTDDAGLTATFVLNVNITDPPHPPVSKPKATHIVSLCSGDTLSLDGSDSFDPDEGLHQTGCAACPNDTITAWNWDLNGAPFTYADGSGEMLNLGTGFTTYFPSAGSYDIGLQVTDNTAAAYPASGQPNLLDQAFGKVLVYNAGPCDLVAAGQCDSVRLAWTSTGAASYRIYRSLTGPNSDFVEVGNTTSTSTDVSATLGQTQWFRVAGITGANTTMSKAVQVTLAFTDCVCITDLAVRPKDRQNQLTWTAQPGATCYNIYRSTTPSVATVPANKIKDCLATTIYLDTGLVNGTRYYYKVTKVVGNTETCVSIESSGVPLLPRR